MASKSFFSRVLQIAPKSFFSSASPVSPKSFFTSAPQLAPRSSYATPPKRNAVCGSSWEVPANRLRKSDIENYGQYAIDCHNVNKNDNQKLQFVEVVRASGSRVKGTDYYLTLKAKDQHGMMKLFRAKVWVDPWHQEGGTKVTCTEFFGPISDMYSHWGGPTYRSAMNKISVMNNIPYEASQQVATELQ
ncbi:hypothetical protein ACHQM5_010340 [Ranunculus cassubicifolius]